MTIGDDGALHNHGFARYTAADTVPGLGAAQTHALLAPLADSFPRLPADPHDPTASRYRRYAAAILLPWQRTLTWIPGIPDPEFGAVGHFGQGQHNPEYPDTTRRFPYIDEEILHDRLLHRLILFDLDQVPWRDATDRHPVHVGVHLVRLATTSPATRAVSSPDCLHQDGGAESVYFVHLLARDNALGGDTVIAAPQCAGRAVEHVPDRLIRARFTLRQPLDAYGVIDNRVSHYVSPIRPADPTRPASRCAILIGLTPYIPQP